METWIWPANWKRAVLITIRKKGDLQLCSNYSTIYLISHAGKLMQNHKGAINNNIGIRNQQNTNWFPHRKKDNCNYKMQKIVHSKP